MRGWAWLGVCGVCALVAACSNWFSHSCTDMACLGGPTKVDFVDADGHPVAPKGELRDAQSTRPFDCADSPRSSGFEFGCSAGTLSIPADQTQRSNEVRFVRDDGSFGDWQAFTVTITTQTDEDFNGPDCPCSWSQGKTKPLLVPEDARNPLRQPLLNTGGAPADP